ncbi:hypothetical protein N0V93_004731 [Gnomoniopsis smithogilvyi]|uniref:Uncharacterized protein n=1 Tax=Gnomoniopsis smithogilvyi TaxID=1191159 RepID=A0A9W9CXG1_9PEZI|nr:hypothetical protein N0V93_004731 [Gnomoniopsis smithogilvyi]
MFPRMISAAIRSPIYAGICGSTVLVLSAFFYKLTEPSHNFDFSYSATPGHENSLAFNLLNPKRYPTEQDRFSLRIPKRDLRTGISDEEILARFTKGFFGGWVFTPERWFFLLTRFSLMDHDALSHVSPVNLTNKKTERNGHVLPVNQNQIWKASIISRTSPIPLGTLLFGNFLVFESSVARQAEREALFPAAKHVTRPDFVFTEVIGGPSKTFGLLPSHRFEVTRENEGAADEMVKVTLSHVRCDPFSGKPVRGVIKYFHLLYARLLFADGIREVVQR